MNPIVEMNHSQKIAFLKTLSPEERIAYDKKKNAERQQRYYDANKDKVSSIKKDKYREKNPEQPKDIKTPLELELDNMIDGLEELAGATKTNLKFALNTIVKQFNIRDMNEFTDILSRPLVVIDKINQLKKLDGEDYSLLSKQLLVNAVMSYIKHFHKTIPQPIKDTYNLHFKLNHKVYLDECVERNAIENLPSFAEYMDRVKTKYGIDNYRYLIVALYNELPRRDDFAELVVVKTKKHATDNATGNSIFVGKRDAVIVLNYPSKNTNKVEKKLSNETAKLVRNHIDKNEIKYGEHLFKQQSISQIISRINIDLDVGNGGAINVLRRMKINDENRSVSTNLETKQKLAVLMGHHPFYQQTLYSNGYKNT
jgi:hypothetical protein